MTTRSSYSGHRYPADVISHAVWLYFRFPVSLRMVEEMLAARGILVSHETVRRWGLQFGQEFANQIRRRLLVNFWPIGSPGLAAPSSSTTSRRARRRSGSRRLRLRRRHPRRLRRGAVPGGRSGLGDSPWNPGPRRAPNGRSGGRACDRQRRASHRDRPSAFLLRATPRPH